MRRSCLSRGSEGFTNILSISSRLLHFFNYFCHNFVLQMSLLVGLVLICCHLAPRIMIFYKLLGGRNLPPATSFWHGKDDKEESGSAEERVKPEDCSGSDGGSQPEEGLRHQKSRRPVGPEMERGVVYTRWQTFGRSLPTRR